MERDGLGDSPEGVDRGLLVSLLKEKGLEDPEVIEMLQRFSDDLYPAIGRDGPSLEIRVNAQVKRVQLYYDAGFVAVAYQTLVDVYDDQISIDTGEPETANRLARELNVLGKRLFYPRTDYVPDAGQD